jgi:hypothetical protein
MQILKSELSKYKSFDFYHKISNTQIVLRPKYEKWWHIFTRNNYTLNFCTDENLTECQESVETRRTIIKYFLEN